MVWTSWMRLCIVVSVIIIGCISKLEAATLHRSHADNEENVRKCGYDVSVFSHFSNKTSNERQIELADKSKEPSLPIETTFMGDSILKKY